MWKSHGEIRSKMICKGAVFHIELSVCRRILWFCRILFDLIMFYHVLSGTSWLHLVYSNILQMQERTASHLLGCNTVKGQNVIQDHCLHWNFINLNVQDRTPPNSPLVSVPHGLLENPHSLRGFSHDFPIAPRRTRILRPTACLERLKHWLSLEEEASIQWDGEMYCP